MPCRTMVGSWLVLPLGGHALYHGPAAANVCYHQSPKDNCGLGCLLLDILISEVSAELAGPTPYLDLLGEMALEASVKN